MQNYRTKRVGPTAKKILLLLSAGLSLGLSRRPDTYFRIIKDLSKEWKKINEASLRQSIKRLYRSKLINYKENIDGTITLILSDEGKNRILKFKLDDIVIKKPKRWDSLWRLVLFDIPETRKKGRMALVLKLKELGFYPLQKSAFIYPYKCKDEIDFIVEIFELVPYVRFLRVRDIDIAADLRARFNL